MILRLAAFVSEYELFEIQITRNYALEEWKEDLKKVMRIAGLQGRNVLFLFRDSQILYESFLEDVNNLIHSGI